VADSGSETRSERGWRVAARLDRSAFGFATAWRRLDTDGQRWDEWTIEGALALDPVIVSGSVGTRSGAVREQWAAGRLIGRLGPRASLVLEMGGSPASPLTSRPGGRYAALGLVVTTGGLVPTGS